MTPPLPVTVRVKVSVPSAVGAVKTGRAVVAPVSVPPVPAVRVQAQVTLSPQGSSKPFSAPSTPSVTVPPEATSIPPADPALAMGLKRALPGLWSSRGSARFVSFSKRRGGSDESWLSLRNSKLTPVSRSNAPGAMVCRRFPSSPSRVNVLSSPSNTPSGKAVRSLALSCTWVILPRSAKSPRFSTAMLWSPRSSVPLSAPRCAVTVAQVSAVSLCAVRTRSTSLSRTCAVRPQMPPVSPGGVPLTLCPDCVLNATWSRIAGVPWTLTIAPPASVRLSAATAMPSLSVSACATVYANTSRRVPEPRMYSAKRAALPLVPTPIPKPSRGVPSEVCTTTRSPKVTANSMVSSRL